MISIQFRTYRLSLYNNDATVHFVHLRLVALNLELKLSPSSPVPSCRKNAEATVQPEMHRPKMMASSPSPPLRVVSKERCPTTSMAVSRGAVTWHANADIVSTCIISILELSTHGVEWPLPCIPHHDSVADELPESGRPLLIIPAPAPRVGSGLAHTTPCTAK